MEVFRIVHTKWANNLTASCYAAGNCSLVCLENLVHRNGFGTDSDYR